ncbi:hypothetical protein OH807_19755 [Kitasatospora sp. NBC_01560]|uniref:hypothetical protein n=1 Tax=Kitasatospora sp. NBC_01560 TaxID=2975965 RepID=UPI003870253A
MTERTGARELYEALLRHEGGTAYRDVVVPWLDRAAAGHRSRLARAAGYRPWWREEDGRALLEELYALSRVADLLLLAFQPPADGPEAPGPPLPGIPEQQYVGLFAALGMDAFGGGAFDPFLHEIVEVEQAADPDAPIEVTDVLWPGLMLGELLFVRAGVRVRAGRARARRGVADRSPLYWTFRRRHRPTVDLSHGWGGNSQWRTDLRLDYRTAAGDRLNVAGTGAVDGRPDLHPDHPQNLGPDERLLTPAERRDLLRHRCLLRAPEAAGAAGAAGAFAAERPDWSGDLMPFDWRLPAAEE